MKISLLPLIPAFGLLGPLSSPARPQGALSLLERARLVVEGRLLAAPPAGSPPVRFFQVSRALKGPHGLGRIPLLSLDRVSAHRHPLPGRDYLLFLAALPPGLAPLRVYTVLQQEFGATPLDEPGGRDFASHVLKLSRSLPSKPLLAAELLRALMSSSPLLVRSAALDMEAHPRLLPFLGPAGGKKVLRRLLRLGPSCPWAPPLVHALGEIRPPGWAKALAGLLERPGGAFLAPAVGQVLGKVEGARLVEILGARLEGPSPLSPSSILALGATGRPEALPFLRRLLREKGRFSLALTALTFHRSWRAVRVIREELASRGEKDPWKGKALLRALARMGIRPARQVLRLVACGKLAPELSGTAASLLR